jgi:hypothetical protein
MKRSAIGVFVVAVLTCTAGCGEEGGCSLRLCDPCTRHEQCCVGGCRPAYELNDDGDPIITPETYLGDYCIDDNPETLCPWEQEPEIPAVVPQSFLTNPTPPF